MAVQDWASDKRWYVAKEFGQWEVYSPHNEENWSFPTFAEAYAAYLDSVTCERVGPASGSRCERQRGHGGWCAYADLGFR